MTTCFTPDYVQTTHLILALASFVLSEAREVGGPLPAQKEPLDSFMAGTKQTSAGCLFRSSESHGFSTGLWPEQVAYMLGMSSSASPGDKRDPG